MEVNQSPCSSWDAKVLDKLDSSSVDRLWRSHKCSLSPEHHQQGRSFWREAGNVSLQINALEEAKLTPLVKPQGPSWWTKAALWSLLNSLMNLRFLQRQNILHFSFQISQRLSAIQRPCLSLNHNPCFSFDTYFPPSSSFVCLASNTNHLEDTEFCLASAV